MVKWFVIQQEKVTGPFHEDEIKAQVSSGLVQTTDLVWGRPLDNWTSINRWLAQLSSMTAGVENLNSQQMWHYAVGGDSKGPMTRTELVNELKAIRNQNNILVWTKGMKAWVDLYDFHDLLDEIGLNRREHPRCKINGQIVVSFENQTFIGQLSSISVGGFGCTRLNTTLPIGQDVKVEIKSDALGDVVTAKANVQYISQDGYLGCKFATLNMEAKSRILSYVRATKDAEKLAA
jgi:hypothetical protein